VAIVAYIIKTINGREGINDEQGGIQETAQFADVIEQSTQRKMITK
jgi:hypothetical protein